MIAPIIVGLGSLVLSSAEKQLLKHFRPAGFIIFGRNIDEPKQVRHLISSICQFYGSHKFLFLIDQEGGRVCRLKPPHWRLPPPARYFGDLWIKDPQKAKQELANNAVLIARELTDLGLNAVCAPVLDLIIDGQDPIIGDRAFSSDPDIVAKLGRCMAETYLNQHILPIIKHIPGHGRAKVDSHHHLPRITEDLTLLKKTDFRPFQLLADMPMAMTAHIQIDGIDPDRPVTTSPALIKKVIRDIIGFQGILLSDDLSMKALSGTIAERTRKSLLAGCQLVLHCNGDLGEMEQVATAAGSIDATTEHLLNTLHHQHLLTQNV